MMTMPLDTVKKHLQVMFFKLLQFLASLSCCSFWPLTLHQVQGMPDHQGASHSRYSSMVRP